MPKKRRKLDVFCQNPKCQHFNKKSLKNIVRNGKKKNGTQNYKCTTCNVSFVRTKGTPLYYSKLPKKEVKKICDNLVEKSSFRGVARATRHSLNAIYRVADKVGKHCEKIDEWLLAVRTSVRMLFRSHAPSHMARFSESHVSSVMAGAASV